VLRTYRSRKQKSVATMRTISGGADGLRAGCERQGSVSRGPHNVIADPWSHGRRVYVSAHVFFVARRVDIFTTLLLSLLSAAQFVFVELV
jgi:hypothetical protein